MGLQSEVNMTFYSGIRVLEPLAMTFGFDCAKLNLFFCQCLSIYFAYFYFFKLLTSSKQVRQLFLLAIGLAICYICNGTSIFHHILLSSVCYVIMHLSPAECIHKIIFPVCMVYLSLGHGYRFYVYYRYGVNVLNLYTYTGSLMLMVQKLVALSFSLYDGCKKTHMKQSSRQQKEALTVVPPPIEFFSYMFHFQTIMTGPFVFFSDFKAFINGTNFPTDKMINPVKTVIDKLAFAFTFLLLASVFGKIYRLEMFNDPEVNALPLLNWLIMLCFVMFINRLSFYYHWIMADAICNLSGLGINGLTPDGKPRWDLVTNINVWGVELARSWKEHVDAWNISTVAWFRFIVFDRVDKTLGGLYISILSPLWHGFFIGYYITNLNGALLYVSALSVRKSIRPYFQKTIFFRELYDVLTTIITQPIAALTMLPLHTQFLNPALAVYKKIYFAYHLVILFAIFVLPKIVPPQTQTDDEDEPTTAKEKEN